jgi:hypothetical protein
VDHDFTRTKELLVLANKYQVRAWSQDSKASTRQDTPGPQVDLGVSDLSI